MLLGTRRLPTPIHKQPTLPTKAVTTMSTTTTIHILNPMPAHVDEHTECPCGQDLETCTSAHCPRCGVTLHLAA